MHQWRLTIRHRHGLSVAEYEAMSACQRGLCEACGLPPEDGRPLFVDHCHATGAARGLLHPKCNSALGFAKDSPAILRAMADYLERHAKSREAQIA